MLRFQKTKKGVASLYIVVFTTILFGVIALSFIRIMLSESSQTSNDDLSRSAYDSALAGVEDARYMVNEYYKCLGSDSATGASGSDCNKYNIFSDNDDCINGFKLAYQMYGISGPGEVKIQEDSAGNNTDQAYTCVIVKDVVPDYRGTLSSDTRTKLIPLMVQGNGSNASTPVPDSIEFSWYSQLNQGSQNNNFKTSSMSTEVDYVYLPNGEEKTIPPTISLTYIKVPKEINMENLTQENNTGGVVYSTMVLVPTKKTNNDENSVTIQGEDVINTGNVTEKDVVTDVEKSHTHKSFEVTCSTATEFACKVILKNDSSKLMDSSSNVFLVVSLPYGDAYSDFSVELKNGPENINLKGVQISVDSTGRANQLVRRVETRLDPADLFFPYPQYALELTGNDAESLKKKFWVTINCWTEQGVCDNNNNTP